MRIGVCRSPAWEQASPDMRHALEHAGRLLSKAGWWVEEVEMGAEFARLAQAQAVLHRHEAYRCLGSIREAHADLVSEVFRNFIDAGARVSAQEYADALSMQAACRERLDAALPARTLWLTPGAPGVAPHGIAATGDPAFSRIWTALGVPCLGFPAALDASGMPLGLQWVARRGEDRAMLSAAVELCLVLGAPRNLGFTD